MNYGKLYLIPTLLHPEGHQDTLPLFNLRIVQDLRYFIVENDRTTRRMLRRTGFKGDFNELNFFVLNKNTLDFDIPGFLKPALEGNDIGLMSEAGLPCIADPGAAVVSLAHQQQIPVVPLSGPSSIFLALMASGFNGQNFAFQGYLPVETKDRASKIRHYEKESKLKGQTQIFIETPYRNNQLLDTMITHCMPSTMLCIACEITHPVNELIISKPVAQWKKNRPDLHKKPAVFLLFAGRL